MGRRRRRKVVKVLRRRLPKIFLCPRCGTKAVTVNIHKESRTATISCGRCGLRSEARNVSPLLQEVDVFCRFTDMFHAGEIS